MKSFRTIGRGSRFHIALAIVLVLGWPSAGSAVDVYVATTGSDKNPGTEAQPKQTIAAGLGSLGAGGTLFIRGGTYPQGKTLSINKGGASNAARTIVRPYQSEKVAIVGSGGNTISIDASFVTLAGLDISQADPDSTEPGKKGGHGILIWKKHDVTVSGCTIHHIRGSGVFVGSDDYNATAKTSSVSNILFEGNTVHHTCMSNSARTAKGWGQGLSSFFSVGTVFRKNVVYKNWGEGINLCENDRALVEGNIIYDNYSVNLYLDHATNATIRGNLLHTSDDKDRSDFFPYWSKTTSPGNGILLANEATQKQTNSGHKIYNNISINCGSGIHVSGSLADSLIANNTFVVGAEWGTGIGGGKDAVNCSLVNNIVVSSGRALGGASTQGKWTSDYNLWFGGKCSGIRGAHDIAANPRFATGSGLLADGYRLQAASPAINAGTTVGDVTKDYWGAPRPQGATVDIGACEFGAGGSKSDPLPGGKDEKKSSR